MNQQLPSQVEIIPVTQLNVGDVVRFHGARFQVHTAYMYRDQLGQAFTDPVMVALSTWLDGEIMLGYFGPTKDWNFQGNEAHRVRRELAPPARTQAAVDAALQTGLQAVELLGSADERAFAVDQVHAWYQLQTAGILEAAAQDVERAIDAGDIIGHARATRRLKLAQQAAA